ncbi:response regulator [Lentibacillus sp. CBA3610]|uniref:response regulator n=1 Tax=Lentibacillus sp. CBA3610 TaxID=2518176 RepID=UPI001595EF61|nr:response regulator [Lentibacillus sp. CBA3610]QKY70495.1 response regulator [Lentibacillus sp. CBA3610]
MTKKILVVDDQPGIRMLIQEVFMEEGYDVTTAETGKEALDKLYRESFDLLILDYKLPVVDGLEVLNQLEHNQIYIPAIVMSGLAEDARKDLQQFSLIKEVFAKPFNIQELNSFVKRILN